MAHICLPLLSLRQAQCDRVVATCDDGHATSAAGLHDAVACLSSALTSGPVRLARGSRVALLAHNSDLLFSTLLAVLDAGGIACPLNWRWSHAELAAALQLVQPVALLADDECLAAAHGALQQLGSSRCTLVHMCRTDSSSSSSSSTRGAALATWSLPRLLGAAAPQQHQHQPPALQLLQPQDGAALIVFTSGTTGASKGVVLSHASVVHQAAAKLATVGYAAPDVYLHLAPLFHIGGLSSAFAVLMAGGAHVFLRRYSAATALALIRRHAVTALIAVPAMMQDMVDAAAGAAGVQDHQQQQQQQPQQQLPSLRRVLVGAGGMQPALQRAVAALFPRAQLHTAYGMTEAGSSITFVGLPEQQALMAAAGAQQQQPGDAGVCVGRPGPGIAVSIDAAALQKRQRLSGDSSSSGKQQPHQHAVVGEVLTRGPHVMQGYWRAAEATRQALLPGGWLRTGDLGRLDASGNLWLVGRLKAMIKSGGENVFAAEVQAALLRHPGVTAAAVLGLPHPRLGEQVAAVLVLASPWCAAAAAVCGAVQGSKDGAPGGRHQQQQQHHQQQVLSLAALQEHCRACGLSPFKVPRVAAAVDQLPLNSSGKVMAAALRQQLMQCMQQDTGDGGGGGGTGGLQLLQDTAGSSFSTSKL